ncbi:MAG: cobyrinate a,c-diamide synthase [Nitrospirota bacterium]|nr:cobyrinate a,c-diamide synthase [Nitrospirota bacterium]
MTDSGPLLPSADRAAGSARSAFLIAGTRSGVGKTTVALGLMGALASRGLAVAPFKAGPDFIDPGLHRLAAGRPSRNLDSWMMPPAAVAASFARGLRGHDVAVVEGVMGLFDGAAGDDLSGSSADLARRLGIPVILVVDASGMAASVAAVVHGFATLDPDVNVAGVILNRVASPNHLEHLVDALNAHTTIPVLGHLPRDVGISLPERHLGLVTAEDLSDEGVLTRMAERVAEGVDVDRLLALTTITPPPAPAVVSLPEPVVRIGVARDAAFCFIYPDTVEALEAAGARIVPFSPLSDPSLPEVDALYLPGGYPELHGEALSANVPMLEAVRGAAGTGMPIYAECGGLVYLSQGVTRPDGATFGFCGVLPARCRLLEQRAALGYREIAVTADGPLGQAGSTLRGHEFHYAEIDRAALESSGVSTTLTLARRGGKGARAEGYRVDNVLATWAHVLADHRVAADWVAFVQTCRNTLAAQRSAGLS